MEHRKSDAPLVFGISPNLRVKDSNKTHKADDKKNFVITATSRSNSPLKDSTTPILANGSKTVSPFKITSLDNGPIKPQKIGLKLLCYNLFMRPPPVSQRGNDYKDERMIEVIPKFKAYDICCFQELFSKANKRRHKICKAAVELGLKYSTYVKPPSNTLKFKFPIIDSGLVILSRFPIIDSDFKRFESAWGWDRFADKGCLYAKILITQRFIIHVFNTHPQAGYGDWPEAVKIKESDPERYGKIITTYLVRMDQVCEMRRFIEEKVAKADADAGNEGLKSLVVIMGDMNIDGRGPDLDTDILLPHFEKNPLIQRFIEKRAKAGSATFKEYDIMAHILSGNEFDILRNCALQSLGEHPVTKTTFSLDAKGNQVSLDNYFCDPAKTQHEAKCLDYMLILEKTDQMSPQKALKASKEKDKNKNGALEQNPNRYATIKEIICNVNKFPAEPGKKYHQLSDHWGLESTIKVLI